MDIINNKGENIGSLNTAVSNDQGISINRIHDSALGCWRTR
jgi:hypothetical protein